MKTSHVRLIICGDRRCVVLNNCGCVGRTEQVQWNMVLAVFVILLPQTKHRMGTTRVYTSAHT